MQINNIYNDSGMKFSVTESELQLFYPSGHDYSTRVFLNIGSTRELTTYFCPYWHMIILLGEDDITLPIWAELSATNTTYKIKVKIIGILIYRI